MRRFTRLYMELDATSSTSAKTEALVGYFRDAPAEDSAWAVALFLGQRPKGSTSSRAVTQLALDASGLPRWLFDECRAVVGELAETIALLLPSEAGAAPSEEPLSRVIHDRVMPLAGAGDEERASIIRDAWAGFDRDQRLVYLKLIRGGFRVGVQRRMLSRALAEVAGVAPAVMEHRLAGSYAPTGDAYRALLSEEHAGDHEAKPYPFFLASQLADEPGSLGDRGRWFAEWKWDGIRAQLLRRHRVHLWSRGEELITHQFPEIVGPAASLPEGTVLDGEILLWGDNAPRPFAALQRRLNRKVAPTPQLSLFVSETPVFMAFDLLEADGQDLRERPARERRERLEAVVEALDAPAIRASALLSESTWDELGQARESSRDRGVEGLVLKHAESPYASGRVRPEGSHGWWKWKVDPYTADAVLVYAYPGSGRRATLYTDYAFAVWGQEDGERVLMPFTRAYSGLDQSEIEALDGWIRRNTVRTMGPAREVRPERVFEIGFEGIARSPRHKAGIAVRFPRILRERTDKRAHDADTIETLTELLRMADPDT